MSATTKAARGNKVAYVVIGAFVGLCAIGWAIIIAHTEGTPGISPEVISWQAAARSVRVHYQVAKPRSDDVHCAIVAFDTSHAEVGRVLVDIPPGTASVETRREVPTSSLATAVDVRECRRG